MECLARGLPVLTTNETPWITFKKNAGWIINNSYIELKLVLSQIFRTYPIKDLQKKGIQLKLQKTFTKEKLRQNTF